MKIGVIGAGNIGGTLARKLSKAGNDVTVGVRDSGQRPREVGEGVQVADQEQAAAAAEVVLFAIPGAAMAELIGQLAPRLGGKALIDATNNMGGGGTLNSVSVLAEKVPTAGVYRAFNTLGWENFENPVLDGAQADLFYCGSDGPSRTLVERVIQDVGLRPVYVGGPEQAGVVDGVASLWFALVFGQKRPRRLAFKLLTE